MKAFIIIFMTIGLSDPARRSIIRSIAPIAISK